MKILTVANEKGGVGKTLVSVQFAFYCAFKFGLKVALLDLDQQGSASNTVKVNSNSAIADISASSFMLEPVESFSSKIKSHIPELVSSSNLVCFPADDALSDIEKKGDDFHELVAYYFSENINSLESYFDLVVIDTNPNPDVRSNLGLAVATHLISPLELNKEPMNLLELGENKDIIMKLQGNDFTTENTDSYHRALDFLREIKTELQDTPMEKEEYIRIEFFF